MVVINNNKKFKKIIKKIPFLKTMNVENIDSKLTEDISKKDLQIIFDLLNKKHILYSNFYEFLLLRYEQTTKELLKINNRLYILFGQVYDNDDGDFLKHKNYTIRSKTIDYDLLEKEIPFFNQLIFDFAHIDQITDVNKLKAYFTTYYKLFIMYHELLNFIENRCDNIETEVLKLYRFTELISIN